MTRNAYLLSSLSLGLTLCALAQTPPTPPATEPPATTPQTTAPGTAPATPPAAPTWSAGGIDFSGAVDGYFDVNFNHPADKLNGLRNFDTRANSFALNFAKFTMEHTADPVGFKFELAAGRAMDIIHATDPAGSEVVKHIFQAYVSVKPKTWHGFEFDFGKFMTSAGAEVTETYLNYNYSRSFLYAFGPYYHFGVRTTMPIGKRWTAGVQVVNGWNNVEDNNSPKTVGLTSTFTASKFTWANNYYFGNEKNDTLDGVKIKAPGLRHFFDTVVGINPNGNASMLINFDYGTEKNPGSREYKFYGFSIAGRLQHGIFAFSPRYDWYKDRDGFITGTVQTLQEFTATADLKLKEGFLARAEYRRDWSGVPYFNRGNQTSNSTSQPTLLVGFVVYFGPKR